MKRFVEMAREGTAGKSQWSARRLGTYVAFALADSLIVAIAYFLALQFRYEGAVPDWRLAIFPIVALILAALHVSSNLLTRMYWRGWRYASLHDALALGQSVALASGLALVIDALLSWRPLPLTVVPVGGLLALVGMGLARFRGQIYQELAVTLSRSKRSRLLIIGAGRSGQWLARETLFAPTLGYQPVCFVDDDPEKLGQRCHGIVVAGNRHDIQHLVQTYRIDAIVLAISSLNVETQREILAYCEETAARVKIMARLPDLLTHQFESELFRDARLEDLLGRPPVSFGERNLAEALGQSVMITGAAGSIGSELARQVVSSGPQRLILLDVNESGLFDLALELEPLCKERDVKLELVVGNVSRAERIAKLFALHRPEVVFHAAAYKHVPLMESHPGEAAIINVIGTYNVCQAAAQTGCQRFVFISTDKAVEPSNVMGATKRLGEQIVQGFAAAGKGNFTAIRFGNVLGSRGSVVPTFARQIEQGGPLTITHRDATRYFMTIPEAVSLIIEAAHQARGGEIFILDMGNPVSIMDLARKMIRLHGLRPEQDIHIQEIGLRPGEKLHESLASRSEALAATNHPRVSRVISDASPASNLTAIEAAIADLAALAEHESAEAVTSVLLELSGRPESFAPASVRASSARQR